MAAIRTILLVATLLWAVSCCLGNPWVTDWMPCSATAEVMTPIVFAKSKDRIPPCDSSHIGKSETVTLQVPDLRNSPIAQEFDSCNQVKKAAIAALRNRLPADQTGCTIQANQPLHLICNKYMEIKYMEIKHMEIKYMEIKYMEIKHMEIKHMEIKYMEIKHMEIKYMEIKYMEIKHMEIKQKTSIVTYKHCMQRICIPMMSFHKGEIERNIFIVPYYIAKYGSIVQLK
eukprot:Em0007g826a